MKIVYLLYVNKCSYPNNYSNTLITIIIKLDKTNFTLNFFTILRKKILNQDEKFIDKK